MESFERQLDPFVYDAAYPFLFCTLCKYAVLVPSTSDHLKDVHKDIPSGRRTIVRVATNQLHGVYQRKEEMAQFRFPDPDDKPIPYIHRPADNGIRCNECGWITTSKKRMQAHQKTHPGSGGTGWRSNIRCQRLFAKGPYSVWFEVGWEEGVFGGEPMAWLGGNHELGQGSAGDIAGDGEPRRPAFDVIDFGTPMQTREQGGELELMENNIIASSSQAGTDDAAGLDPSWFAMAKSRVGCVLCTVRGFQLRCMRGVTGAATESRAKEVFCEDRAAACEQCGLRHDWHEASIGMRERADERLRDDELVCVARMIALWEQMKSVGSSLGELDAKQMAKACIWLEAGARDADGLRNSNTGTHERVKYETPGPEAAITRNCQIIPTDKYECSADAFLDDGLGMDDLEAMQSSISAAGGNVHKRKASGDLATGTASKMGRWREPNKAGGVRAAPSLFNGAMVAQVRRTDTGMRHEAMGQHELDAYTKWTERYQKSDGRNEAKEFRELHKAWKRRCGVCWFSRGSEERTSTEALHRPDNCPQKGSAIWESAMQREDVIGSRVLTKKVMGGELVGWPVSSGCWKCGLPAWRCDSFEHIPGHFCHPCSNGLY